MWEVESTCSKSTEESQVPMYVQLDDVQPSKLKSSSYTRWAFFGRPRVTLSPRKETSWTHDLAPGFLDERF